MRIEQPGNWLGRRLEALTQPELLELIEEIADFRSTGLLKGKKMKTLERQFSENVSHTPGGSCMRLIEDEILFEAARRFYNSCEKAHSVRGGSSQNERAESST